MSSSADEAQMEQEGINVTVHEAVSWNRLLKVVAGFSPKLLCWDRMLLLTQYCGSNKSLWRHTLRFN